MSRVHRPGQRGWIVGSMLVVLIGAGVLEVWTARDREPDVDDAGSPSTSRILVWIDRRGHLAPLPVPARGYVYPRISPDGRLVAVDIRDQAHGIWLWDMTAQRLAPFSTGRASDISPVWTKDGRSVVFARGRAVPPAILRQSLERRSLAGTRELATPSLLLPNSLSPDGTRLVVTASVASGFDLQALSLDGSGDSDPVVSTSVDELNGEISPDGRWLAYQSRRSGQFEVWVRPFGSASRESAGATMDSQLRQVSSDGGTRPVWARNRRNSLELFYLTVDNRMMAVPISTGDELAFGPALQLFSVPLFADLVGRTFDVSPDGERFLAVMELMRTR